MHVSNTRSRRIVSPKEENGTANNKPITSFPQLSLRIIIISVETAAKKTWPCV